MNEVPEDWVLFEAAKHGLPSTASLPRSSLVDFYECGGIFRALCDMIAKYEQPPVDPDVEAVKRILAAWEPLTMSGILQDTYPQDFARAVAQYKLERAK